MPSALSASHTESTVEMDCNPVLHADSHCSEWFHLLYCTVRLCAMYIVFLSSSDPTVSSPHPGSALVKRTKASCVISLLHPMSCLLFSLFLWNNAHEDIEKWNCLIEKQVSIAYIGILFKKSALALSKVLFYSVPSVSHLLHILHVIWQTSKQLVQFKIWSEQFCL